ncbi:unnamed protein product [Xylocopa violacea]|uniref:Uncharacterized protein n=1 Tax=Xylocopa violacea TaxID=135666 RepID=A0ABP1NDG7_XYLVO
MHRLLEIDGISRTLLFGSLPREQLFLAGSTNYCYVLLETGSKKGKFLKSVKRATENNRWNRLKILSKYSRKKKRLNWKKSGQRRGRSFVLKQCREGAFKIKLCPDGQATRVARALIKYIFFFSHPLATTTRFPWQIGWFSQQSTRDLIIPARISRFSGLVRPPWTTPAGCNSRLECTRERDAAFLEFHVEKRSLFCENRLV